MRTLLLTSLLLAALGLTACDKSHYDVSIDNAISLEDGHVAVHAPGHPDADISASGDLSIAGNPITATPAQHDLLKSYYAAAIAIRDHGIATGKAGAQVAGTALSSVAKGLASGHTDQIDGEVNASAAKVEAQAAKICEDLQQLGTLQNALAAQLEAFRPYATIKPDEANDCLRGLKDHDHGGDRD